MKTNSTDRLAQRWLALIQAGERNVRVMGTWWYDWRNGDRSRRVVRARSINRAANRTDNLFFRVQDSARADAPRIEIA